MKIHVFRPLIVTLMIVGLILLARVLYVPDDFGSHERGYMYGWHRKGDEETWKNFKVKYQGAEYCSGCHEQKYKDLLRTPHKAIQCENCHGPALDHPSEPPRLTIDKSRQLCLRCHFPLAYPSSGRARIKGVDPDVHNPGKECSLCHDPHHPNLEGLR